MNSLRQISLSSNSIPKDMQMRLLKEKKEKNKQQNKKQIVWLTSAL